MLETLQNTTNISESLRNQSLPSGVDLSLAENTSKSFSAQISYEYAGYWIRSMAGLVDGFLFIIIFMAFGIVLIFSLVATEIVDGESAMGLAVPALVFTFLCFPILINKYGASPGKLLFHLKIVEKTGSNIGFKRALFRETTKIMLFVPLLSIIDIVLIVFDKKKQGVDDRLAGTFVIKTQ